MVAKSSVAEVHLWGDLIGAIAYSAGSHYCVFEYNPAWRIKGIDISPLHLPLADTKYFFPSLSYETYKGLPASFADTLPDDFGNAVINAWLARQGKNSSDFNALDRLLYTGSRGMGAIEYKPVLRKDLEKMTTLHMESLVGMAQSVLDERKQLSKNIDQDGMQSIFQIGISAGGARSKAVIGLNADRTVIKSGQSDLPEGFEHYLLKFDGVNEKSSAQEIFGDPQGFGRMEYAYYLMAKDAGINISHCELLEEGERAHFITKRFDREGNSKIHYQSLCAMDHADYKKPGLYSYEQLFTVMRKLKLKRVEALEMFRRMVFNVIARNQDDHTKNFGFMLKKNSQWQLAPAFDLAFSYKKDSPWVHSHQMTINGKRDNFNKGDLLVLANTFHKEGRLIIEQVSDIVSQWPKYAKKANVDVNFSKQIQLCHRKI